MGETAEVESMFDHIDFTAGEDVTLGLLTASTDVNITAGGDIIDGNDVGGVFNNIAADNMDLTAGGDIGTSADPIESSINTVTSTAGGDTFIGNTGDFTVVTIDTVGDISLTGDGNITLGEISGTNVMVTAGDSIVGDGVDGTINVSATAAASLMATTGTVGTRDNAIDVSSGDFTSVGAGDKDGFDISVNVNGMVKGNTLRPLNRVPGLIVLNGVGSDWAVAVARYTRVYGGELYIPYLVSTTGTEINLANTDSLIYQNPRTATVVENYATDNGLIETWFNFEIPAAPAPRFNLIDGGMSLPGGVGAYSAAYQGYVVDTDIALAPAREEKKATDEEGGFLSRLANIEIPDVEMPTFEAPNFELPSLQEVKDFFRF